MIEIYSPTFKSEIHNHACPVCRKLRREPNDLCRKTSGDHKFICVLCCQDYRRRFGTFSDEILSAYLGDDQIRMIPQIAPDQVSDELDRRDAFRREQQVSNAVQEKIKTPTVQLSPEEVAKAKHESLDRMMDTADRITEDEVMAEIEKEKQNGF